jgi:hypothetical protein
MRLLQRQADLECKVPLWSRQVRVSVTRTGVEERNRQRLCLLIVWTTLKLQYEEVYLSDNQAYLEQICRQMCVLAMDPSGSVSHA